MKTEEMSEKIIEFVEGYQPASMYELVRHLGKEAEGDLALTVPKHPNLWGWAGVSETFIHAMRLANPHLLTHVTDPLLYAMDGGFLDLPIAKRIHNYKKPHWLPVTLSIRETASGSGSVTEVLQ